MLITLLTLSLIAAAPAEKGKESEPAAKKELFAKEDWYQSQKGKEQIFTGILKYAPQKEGVIGFGRFNPYRLEMSDKKGVREVYIGGNEKILAEYHGRKVKLIGKAVEMEVEGKVYAEIWPARVELAEANEKETKKEERTSTEKTEGPKIIAKFPGALTVRSKEPVVAMIRSTGELADATEMKGDKATQLAIERFQVKEIDFKKHAIISVSAGTKPTGGYSVEVTGVEVKDKKLVVKWKLNSPGPKDLVTQGFTFPGASILIDKFEGEVVFDPEVRAP